MRIEEAVARIESLDHLAMQECRQHLDTLTKPAGSLGELEEIAVRLAGVAGTAKPVIKDKVVLVMAGDHGVVEEGVSAFPAEVTLQMMHNFLRGGAGINVLARHTGARVVIADLGVKAAIDHPGIINRKVKAGTNNIACMEAMSNQEARTAVEAGLELALTQIEKTRQQEGLTLLGTGEMGIGNTTSASAILAVLSGLPVAKIVGPGTGLVTEKILHKVRVVQRALAVNNPDPRNGLEVLARVGGLEIGGLTGAILGAAACRTPVVVDGFISTAAALVAARIAPVCAGYIFPSHQSAEPGHRYMLSMLGQKPLIHMNMRLGEGTGAVLVMGIIEAATKILAEMATFTDAGISGPRK